MPTLRPAAGAALLLLAALLGACSDDAGDGGGGGALEGGESEVLGAADEGIDGVDAIRVADNTHTEAGVDYDLRPPAGGAHAPVWANCGFYDEAVPDENVVHDLEHGAVWLAYAPDLDAPDLEALLALTRSNPKVIATPYADLGEGEAVVATAWARQLRLDAVDGARLAEFVQTYVDGSQAPEAGVTCRDSPLGEPVP